MAHLDSDLIARARKQYASISRTIGSWKRRKDCTTYDYRYLEKLQSDISRSLEGYAFNSNIAHSGDRFADEYAAKWRCRLIKDIESAEALNIGLK